MTHIVDNLLSGSKMNPMKKFNHHSNASSVTKRIDGGGVWKLIDKKFNMDHFTAETHRKALSMAHGGLVRKVLMNFKFKEWHFHLKVK